MLRENEREREAPGGGVGLRHRGMHIRAEISGSDGP